MTADLKILSGKRQGFVFHLDEGSDVDVGNRKSAKLSIRDPWISYNHARISGEGGRFFIEDLGSSNGTWINGEKVKRQQLNPNDVIYFGKTKVKFMSAGGAEVPANKGATQALEGDPNVPWWDRALKTGDQGSLSGPDTARLSRLEDEVKEERRMRRALEKFLDLPTNASVGDVANAGQLAQEIEELKAQLAAGDGGGGTVDAGTIDSAVEEERSRTEKLRREHMSTIVELEGKVQQAESKNVDLESRLKDKTAQVKKEVEKAKGRLQQEIDELRSSLEDSRKSASDLAAGGDDALKSQTERVEKLEKELEEAREKARASEETIESLEKQAAEAKSGSAEGGDGEQLDMLRSQLWAAVEEATKWKEEAHRVEALEAEAENWKAEHAKIVQEIDEISMEQIDVEEELNKTIRDLKERLSKYQPAEDEPAEGELAEGDPAEGDPAEGDPAEGDPAEESAAMSDGAAVADEVT